jgi:hypothetical protein
MRGEGFEEWAKLAILEGGAVLSYYILCFSTITLDHFSYGI